MGKSTPSQIFIKFYKLKKFGISLQFEEKNKRLKRSLKSLQSIYSGPTIDNEFLNIPKSTRFLIKVSQIINTERDLNIGCRNYPTKEFNDFGECDGKFVNEQMDKLFLGLKPFWTSNIEDVTKLR